MGAPHPADVDRRFVGALVCPILGSYVAFGHDPNLTLRHGPSPATYDASEFKAAPILVHSEELRGPKNRVIMSKDRVSLQNAHSEKSSHPGREP